MRHEGVRGTGLLGIQACNQHARLPRIDQAVANARNLLDSLAGTVDDLAHTLTRGALHIESSVSELFYRRPIETGGSVIGRHGAHRHLLEQLFQLDAFHLSHLLRPVISCP